MKSKNVLAGFLSVSVLTLSAVSAFAANTGDSKPLNVLNEIKGTLPISSEINAAKQSHFNSFTGTVKRITDFQGVEGSKFVLLVNEAGQETNFIVSNRTYILNNAEITEGTVVTGFYDANAPALMIYPPQYNAEVVVVDSKDQNVKVDTFDKDLVSSDHSLKLNISDDTEILSQDGKAFQGELANRKLVVVYGPSTRSIPAQTTPTKVVVLFEKAVPPIYHLTEEEKAALLGDVSTMEIVVNDKKIEAPAAYKNNQGTVMVPLRSVAEAIGLDVKWDSASESVTLGKGISLTIGKDNYNYMKTAPIQLGTAPELVNERTFVPLKFFKEVARMNNAHVFEAQIVINNGEIQK